MQKFTQKDKILLLMVDELCKNKDFQLALSNVLNTSKMSAKQKLEISDFFLSDGIKSLNLELNNLINKLLKDSIPKDFNNYKINERVNFFIIERIKIIDNLIDIKSLFKINTQNRSPINLAKTLFNISDEIWFLTGDRATDFNFYSKRFILMNIYFLSIIHFSKNRNIQSLQNFVDKQIKAVLLFGNVKRKFKEIFIPK
jgi:ubiquinone biosynthesis protein COQ9